MSLLSRLVLLVLLPLAMLSPAASAEKMNVLFIAVDDLRPELGCYGSPVKSPHLDALAKRGLLFNRAYCQQAVCSPSRTSLLTGRRPDTTKIYDLETHFRDTIPDVVTLPQHFLQNGYHTQSFGKIYHGKLNDDKSWSVPHTRSAVPEYGDKQLVEELRKKGADVAQQGGKNKGPASEIADVADHELPDGYIARKAIEAMRQVKDKPFFLAVGFVKPHLPFVAPKRYFDLYPLETIDLPANDAPPRDVPSIAMTNFAELRAYTDMPQTGPLSEEQARQLRRAYYASTSFVDAQVGQVVDELDRLGLREKTIIVVWGDHGWHLGDQGLWCKHTNFENAARTAMMISAPSAKSVGQKSEALTELIDIYPTLCELAGLPLPSGLEGTSLVPLLNDPARPWKKAAFSQYPRQKDVMGYSMKTDRYRYTEWQKRSGDDVVARELYDHSADPGETINLANQSEHAATVTRLSEQLRAGWRGALPD